MSNPQSPSSAYVPGVEPTGDKKGSSTKEPLPFNSWSQIQTSPTASLPNTWGPPDHIDLTSTTQPDAPAPDRIVSRSSNESKNSWSPNVVVSNPMDSIWSPTLTSLSAPSSATIEDPTPPTSYRTQEEERAEAVAWSVVKDEEANADSLAAGMQRFSLTDGEDALHQWNRGGYGIVPSQSYPQQQYWQQPVQPRREESDSMEAQCFEIEFKAGRTETAWASVLDGYQAGEFAIVEADRGRDLGLVVQQVPAPETMKPGRDGGLKPTAGSSGRSLGELKRMIRRALPSELSQLPQKAEDEAKALTLCQQKVAARNLPMVVAEAEYQFDRRKLTFYFRADHRIDFRELIRDLFKVFKTRIWMRQIGSRSSFSDPVMPLRSEVRPRSPDF